MKVKKFAERGYELEFIFDSKFFDRLCTHNTH